MKIKKISIIGIVILIGIVGIVSMYYSNKNSKYRYKTNTIEQNLKDNKFSQAEANIKNFGLKEEDVKKLNDKVKKEKKIVIVKKDIESSLRYLYALKKESNKNSATALIYDFDSYMETVDEKNIEKCKTLGMSEYLIGQEGSYLSYLRDFGIDKNEVIRISKLEKDERKDILHNNEIVKKQIKANEEGAEAQIKDDTEAFEVEEALKSSFPYIGMTEEDLRKCAWGQPEDVKTTTTTYGTSKQSCYSGYKFVYVEDGVVTTIQD